MLYNMFTAHYMFLKGEKWIIEYSDYSILQQVNVNFWWMGLHEEGVFLNRGLYKKEVDN